MDGSVFSFIQLFFQLASLDSPFAARLDRFLSSSPIDRHGDGTQQNGPKMKHSRASAPRTPAEKKPPPTTIPLFHGFRTARPEGPS
jgi:hypothetical protein